MSGTLTIKVGFVGILDKEELVKEIIIEELTKIKEKYGDERKTEIVAKEASIDIEDMIVEGEEASGLPSQTLGQDVVAVINPEPWRKGEGRKFTGKVLRLVRTLQRLQGSDHLLA